MTYKVLIVDDSKLARMAVIKALRGSRPEWPRIEAASAAEALSAMERDAPDIALVDFNMPNRDGLDVAADLRKLKPGIPIGIISANHQQEVIQRTQALGATFLPKPVADATLKEFLESAVRDLQGAAR
jgi:CheY-like chemotaxis protein